MIQEENENAKFAFLFSNRKQWSDAILYANNSNNNVLKTLIEWQYLLDINSGASFYEISEFIATHPDWPEQKKLRIRAEMALDGDNVDIAKIIEWFAKEPPITGVGKISLANALLKNEGKASEKKIESLVREAWVDGDFSESQEKLLLESFGKIIRNQDDIARIDRLLWEEKTAPAERMFSRLNNNQQELYKLRIALQKNKKNASELFFKLSSANKKDIGLLYDRMCFRAKQKDDSGVQELLLAAPKKVPYPDKWWKYREGKIREAMSEGNSKLAEHLLANHGQEEGQEVTQSFVDAIWLEGKFLLEYKQHPKDAYKLFQQMFSIVKYPVSKSRAAYWAAKAAQKAGDVETAKNWFNIASSYPTTFYGQLASIIYYGTAPLRIPTPPSVDNDIREEFNSRSTVQAVRLCIDFDETGLAEKIINHLIANADNESEALLASELATKAGKIHLSVRGAKKALQNNVVLLDAGYPLIQTPDNLELPRELALSITRQESEFDNAAKSPSGALGLMQLLPSTAKETAQKNDFGYNTRQLYDPEYNMTLGSMYLRRMIDNYDGSIIMAIAAYNAGPGNVQKWIRKFGRPENNIDGAVEWIENIPFSETRHYVQRVLENLQIYRHIEAKKQADGDAPKLLLGQDLVR